MGIQGLQVTCRNLKFKTLQWSSSRSLLLLQAWILHSCSKRNLKHRPRPAPSQPLYSKWSCPLNPLSPFPLPLSSSDSHLRSLRVLRSFPTWPPALQPFLDTAATVISLENSAGPVGSHVLLAQDLFLPFSPLCLSGFLAS